MVKLFASSWYIFLTYTLLALYREREHGVQIEWTSEWTARAWQGRAGQECARVVLLLVQVLGNAF